MNALDQVPVKRPRRRVVGEAIADAATDLVFFAGVLAIAAGLAMIYGSPVGLITLGVGLVVAAVVRLVVETVTVRGKVRS